MKMPAMTETIGAPSAPEAEESPEDEPSRTYAGILAGDERWNSIEGLEGLIPALVAATLLESGLSPESRAVSVALLSGTEVRALNKAFRGKDSDTNVLSFPAAPVPPSRPTHAGPIFLGDVALSFETVTEEASAQNKTVSDHAAHLVVHGVLHLAGLDHGSDADAEHMEAAERVILGKFGIPDPYAEDAPPAPTRKI
jgi:probable rRNA maturation factor